ncbi:hypothetical protein ES288_D08G102900v1 [Gossypium darwinii]|uniref:Uncharacterized protein n=1 Tax=Gossypium darwinii TaxID=34276 RepID=A0A5D2BHW7_GOSDA|nr:hypothetical protein ES288_D08G102900v1 [Gossypium darwinii]
MRPFNASKDRPQLTASSPSVMFLPIPQSGSLSLCLLSTCTSLSKKGGCNRLFQSCLRGQNLTSIVSSNQSRCQSEHFTIVGRIKVNVNKSRLRRFPTHIKKLFVQITQVAQQNS